MKNSEKPNNIGFLLEAKSRNSVFIGGRKTVPYTVRLEEMYYISDKPAKKNVNSSDSSDSSSDSESNISAPVKTSDLGSTFLSKLHNNTRYAKNIDPYSSSTSEDEIITKNDIKDKNYVFIDEESNEDEFDIKEPVKEKYERKVGIKRKIPESKKLEINLNKNLFIPKTTKAERKIKKRVNLSEFL